MYRLDIKVEEFEAISDGNPETPIMVKSIDLIPETLSFAMRQGSIFDIDEFRRIAAGELSKDIINRLYYSRHKDDRSQEVYHRLSIDLLKDKERVILNEEIKRINHIKEHITGQCKSWRDKHDVLSNMGIWAFIKRRFKL